MRRKKTPSAIKQKVIKEIESGRLSQDDAAKRLDVGKTTIQGWLSKYRSKGDSGLANDHKNRIYTREYNLRFGWRYPPRTDKYTDDGFIVTNEFGHYFEQKTFKDYYDRLLKDADIGHFTFHALRHTFATRALEHGMDYKTLSAILGHYSVAFTMDTYVHSMDEHKRREMDKMDDMFGMQYSISVENQPYPVLCTLSPDGCTTYVPDFPKVTAQVPTLDAALLEVKQQIQKALRQYKNPPIPTKQEQIVAPNNSVLVLVKAS